MAFLADYTPIQRFRIILASLVMLGLIAYFLSIRNTIQLRKQLTQKETQLASIASAPQTIAQLQQQLDQLDNQLSQGQYDRNALFATISSFCDHHQLSLLEFGEEHRWQEGQITYINNPLQVAGSYQNILRLMYLLEQQQRSGYLSHCKMNMQRKSRRTKKEELRAEIHVQYLEIDQ
ncbi:MAG: type 4a pilus biogenesis protein PilO [Bacteroidota bacterium]